MALSIQKKFFTEELEWYPDNLRDGDLNSIDGMDNKESDLAE